MKKVSVRTIPALLLIVLVPALAAAQTKSDDDHDRMLGAAAMGAEPIGSEEEFIRRMIPHHLEAIDAAILVYVSSEDANLRELAEQIYTTQMLEVQQMKVHYARTYDRLPMGAEIEPMMRSLEEVDGRERDRRFAEDMIAHHRGAVTMAEQLLELPSAGTQVRAFAQQIIHDQEREIEILERWLERDR